MVIRFAFLIAMLAFTSFASTTENPLLGDPPKDGEAFVWYLGHAGWLVRSSEHILIFDATGPFDKNDLLHGAVSPETLSAQDVILFISHAHGDHLDPRVFELRSAAGSSAVVLGWEPDDPGDTTVPAEGLWTEVSGAEVFALHHAYDGIPEGFFLVRSGGVTIFFSGDHGTTSDAPSEKFKKKIQKMANNTGGVDIAFISSFGARGSESTLNAGDIFTIRTLEPKLIFPMHCGGCEERYFAFAREGTALGLPTKFGVADAPGWFFHFRGDPDR